MSERPMRCKNAAAGCVNEAVIKGRCRTCNMYFRRNGRERPPELARRQASLNYKRFHRQDVGR